MWLLKSLFLISTGASLGACARYGLSKLFDPNYHHCIATTFVNALGCFLLGALLVLLHTHHNNNSHSQDLTLFLTVGVFSSFTTFSALAKESYFLIQENFWLGSLYMLGHLIIGVLLFGSGIQIGNLIWKPLS